MAQQATPWPFTHLEDEPFDDSSCVATPRPATPLGEMGLLDASLLRNSYQNAMTDESRSDAASAPGFYPRDALPTPSTGTMSTFDHTLNFVKPSMFQPALHPVTPFKGNEMQPSALMPDINIHSAWTVAENTSSDPRFVPPDLYQTVDAEGDPDLDMPSLTPPSLRPIHRLRRPGFVDTPPSSEQFSFHGQYPVQAGEDNTRAAKRQRLSVKSSSEEQERHLKATLAQIWVPRVRQAANAHLMSVSHFCNQYLLRMAPQIGNDPMDEGPTEDPAEMVAHKFLELLTSVLSFGWLFDGPSLDHNLVSLTALLVDLCVETDRSSVPSWISESPLSQQEQHHQPDKTSPPQTYDEETMNHLLICASKSHPMNKTGHPPPDNKPYCPVCLQVFAGKDGRDRHIDAYDPRSLRRCGFPKTCKDKLFTRKDYLKLHYSGQATKERSMRRPKHCMDEAEAKAKADATVPIYNGVFTRVCPFCSECKSSIEWHLFWDKHLPECRQANEEILHDLSDKVQILQLNNQENASAGGNTGRDATARPGGSVSVHYQDEDDGVGHQNQSSWKSCPDLKQASRRTPRRAGRARAEDGFLDEEEHEPEQSESSAGASFRFTGIGTQFPSPSAVRGNLSRSDAGSMPDLAPRPPNNADQAAKGKSKVQFEDLADTSGPISSRRSVRKKTRLQSQGNDLPQISSKPKRGRKQKDTNIELNHLDYSLDETNQSDDEKASGLAGLTLWPQVGRARKGRG